jgi:hypothetical protein
LNEDSIEESSMSEFAYVLTYLGLAVFVLAVARRIVAYKRNPMHLRWELYPVAHEGGGRASYGGGYLEELEWWNKPRETSRLRELSVMFRDAVSQDGLRAQPPALERVVPFPSAST